jgi:hypothetical protein
LAESHKNRGCERVTNPSAEDVAEVRAKVKLTNAADLALVRRSVMKSHEVRSVETDALIDAGAVSLVLPSFVVEQLGPRGTIKRAGSNRQRSGLARRRSRRAVGDSQARRNRLDQLRHGARASPRRAVDPIQPSLRLAERELATIATSRATEHDLETTRAERLFARCARFNSGALAVSKMTGVLA